MTLPTLFVLALFVAAAHSASTAGRIVGGAPTTIDKYPSIVQVDFRTLGIFWSQSCAATIISPTTAVSAAHCFEGFLFSASRRRIRAGTSNRNSGGIIVSIDSRVNHPTYGSDSNDGDISVIKLSSALTYSANIAQAAVIPQGAQLQDNSSVVHAGWGTVSEGGSPSDVLRDVTIYTVNRELCRERYKNATSGSLVTENMICAGVIDVGGKDACQGDSGGPMYLGNTSTLAGVVSWGEGCGNAYYLGFSTAVSSYTDWIVETAETTI